jgi:hypothetical protein
MSKQSTLTLKEAITKSNESLEKASKKFDLKTPEQIEKFIESKTKMELYNMITDIHKSAIDATQQFNNLASEIINVEDSQIAYIKKLENRLIQIQDITMLDDDN